MKNITLLIIGIILAISSSKGQQQKDITNYMVYSVKPSYFLTRGEVYFYDTALTKEGYLTKSKNQKTAAWILLGGGVAMGTIGGILVSNSNELDLFSSETDNNITTGSILLVAGVLCSLGSIPLFISSSHNAMKAATISFKNQEIFFPHSNNLITKTQPAVTFKFIL